MSQLLAPPAAGVALEDFVKRDGSTPILGDQEIAGNLSVSEEVSAATAAANSAQVGDAGILFGVAQDVSLYRAAASALAIDGDLNVIGEIQTEDIRITGGVGPQTRLLKGGISLQPDSIDDWIVWADTGVEAETLFALGVDGKLMWGDGTGPHDTNLYRSAAGQLRTDGVLEVGDQVITGVFPSDQGVLDGAYLEMTDSGTTVAMWPSGVGGGGLVVGGPGRLFIGSTDTNLYRSAANQLKTDDEFISATGFAASGASAYVNSDGNVSARRQTAGRVVLAETAVGVAGTGMYFGSAGDTNLYRQNANILMTDDSFFADGDLRAQQNQVTRLRIGAAGPSSEAGIQFGSAGDTNLYRASADVLKTDDEFQSAGYISAFRGSASQIGIGVYASSPGISFGSAGDTNLYRSAADTLKTDDTFRTAGSIVVGNGDTITLSSSGPFALNQVNGSGYMEMREQSSDAVAPAADRLRIFPRDNGAGKTQLCVRFATGAVQVISTEP